VVSYAAVRVLNACALNEVLCSGSGVDLDHVRAGSAPSAGPEAATQGAWPHGPADGFCEWLGRGECGGSPIGCQRPHQGK